MSATPSRRLWICTAAVVLACCQVPATRAAASPIPAVNASPEPSAAPAADLSAPLTLEAADRLFLVRNRELISARLQVRNAEAGRVIAGQRPNPVLSVNSAYFSPADPSQTNGLGSRLDASLDTTFRIDQLIERGNKRGLRLAMAEKGLQAARHDLDNTLRSLRLQLAQAYYDLALAEERERITSTNAALYRKSVEAMRLRLRAGDIAPTELARMQVEAEKAALEARQAEAERRRAQLELGLFLGLEDQAEQLRTAAPDLPLQPGQPGSQPNLAELLERRPDVRAARVRLTQAEDAQQLAASLRKADVIVGVQYERQPPGNAVSRNSIGLGVSFPWQLRYRYQGEIAQAEVARQQAATELARTRADALTELQGAWTDLRAAAERMRRYQGDLIPRARQAAQAAEFAYQHGASGLLDLLDARRTLHGLLLDAAATRADYAKAQAAWQAATTQDATP